MQSKDAIAVIRSLGISQREFAMLVGIQPAVVSRWASGQNDLSSTSETLLLLLQKRPELVDVLREIKAGK